MHKAGRWFVASVCKAGCWFVVPVLSVIVTGLSDRINRGVESCVMDSFRLHHQRCWLPVSLYLHQNQLKRGAAIRSRQAITGPMRFILTGRLERPGRSWFMLLIHGSRSIVLSGCASAKSDPDAASGISNIYCRIIHARSERASAGTKILCPNDVDAAPVNL